MYIFIYNKNNLKPIFSTNFGFDEDTFIDVIDSYLLEGHLPFNYSIAIETKDSLIFIAIKRYKTLKTIPKKENLVLSQVLKNVSKIINEEDLFEGSSNNLDFILKKLFPHDISFRLVGEPNSGKKTIFYLLRGLTISTKQESFKYSFEKMHDDKSIMIKNAIGSDINIINLIFLSSEKNIILVLDGTKKDLIQRDPYIKEILKKKDKNKKILIILNKQDLPHTLNPEGIEKILGHFTVGFSAIAPEAPEHLELIISNFLKDN